MSQEAKDFLKSRDFSLKGRIFYPQLLGYKANDKGVNKYSVAFAWRIDDQDQKDQVQEIAAFLGEAKKRFFPNVPDINFGKPIKKWGVYQKKDGSPLQEFYRDCYWINMSSNGPKDETPNDDPFKPIVVDQHKNAILDSAQVYSGRNAVVNFSFWNYNHTGNLGITTNVKAVMLLEAGDKEASSGIDLNSAFGKFASDMGGAAEQAVTPNQAHENAKADTSSSFL